MIAFLALFLACGDKTEDTATIDDTSSTTDTSTTANFIGIQLHLQSSEGFSPIGSNIVLSFDTQSSFSFYAGCNSMGGSVTISESSITFSDISSTEMGCESNYMEQDAWFASFFSSNPSYSFDGTALTLEHESVVLVFTEIPEVPPSSLTDVHWVFDTFISGETASTANLTNYPWVEFATDGTFNLFTGCNSASGEYTQTDDTINATITMTSASPCDETTGPIESHVNTVFTGTITPHIEGSNILLENGTNALAGHAE